MAHCNYVVVAEVVAGSGVIRAITRRIFRVSIETRFISGGVVTFLSGSHSIATIISLTMVVILGIVVAVGIVVVIFLMERVGHMLVLVITW